MAANFIKRFAELSKHDVDIVGGKNASLGEMYSALSGKGVKVPDGFATTSAAYWAFLDDNQLREKITQRLKECDSKDVHSLQSAGAEIRSWIHSATISKPLEQAIISAYALLETEYGENTDVAVRSSATAEDLPDASFAGQQETFLNVRGRQALLDTCKKVYASLFTDRSISYREHKGFDHMQVALSIGVQKMVRSDLGAAGVMFTVDTESGFSDVITITAAYGLGENVVQGAVNPDEYVVHKPTLAQGKHSIIKRQLGAKQWRMIYDESASAITIKNKPVSVYDQQRFALADEDILRLAHQAQTIEQHYGCAMDIEWAKDGLSNELFIVQARPETVHSNESIFVKEVYHLEKKSTVLTHGKSIGSKIGAGHVRKIRDKSEMHRIQKGDVLVADITDPDWEPIMKVASAIVTNRGGRTCHAAIIARELGIPAIVGTDNATEVLEEDMAVTVSCAEGEQGNVYEGILPIKQETIVIADVPKPQTKIMAIVGNPSQAFRVAQLPNDGVGLARMEFIISNHIGIHPRAILDIASVPQAIRKQIEEQASAYASAKEFYIEKLAEGIATLAAAFYPKPVILRTSDFKSNEYAELVGGRQFEPEEENPMIGFRGAARYYADSFKACFALECEAIRRVRNDKGLDNLQVMLPFVRTVDEVKQVSRLMEDNGLKRSENGLKLMLMCEIPANALLAEDFLQYCDGFSIGSNDLTQLTLGVDRDSGLLGQFDERNPAIAVLMGMAISACKKHNKYIGICGQAPSDFPEITEWLVDQGIMSIALNPDSILKMLPVVAAAEQRRSEERK